MKHFNFFVFALYITALYIPSNVHAQSGQVQGDYFRQEGNASWYGNEFEGRKTASGEIFDSSKLTAAHPTLPFGTHLLVTNKNNNRQVTVRVNDRGPFVATRIIDVSRAAAEQLDMIYSGVAPVYIETMQTGRPPIQDFPIISTAPSYLPPQIFVQPPYTPPPAPPPAPVVPAEAPPAYAPIFVFPPAQPAPQPAPPLPPPAPQANPQVIFIQPPEAPPVQPAPQANPQVIFVTPPTPSAIRLIPPVTPQPDKLYKLQVGSFALAQNAVTTYTRLRDAGLNPSYERAGDYYRVVLSGVQGSDVRSVTEKLQAAGFSEALINELR